MLPFHDAVVITHLLQCGSINITTFVLIVLLYLLLTS